MKNSAFGLCVAAIIGLCLGMPSTVMAADVWRAPLDPVDESDDAAGNVVVVFRQPNGTDPKGGIIPKGESHIVVVAHGLLPNTEHLVRVRGLTMGGYQAIVTTNNAGILTLQDSMRADVSGFADIFEPDSDGGWIVRLMSP